MESIKIAIIGRTLNDKRWESLYELLDDGISNGAISEYTKNNIDTLKEVPQCDAFIYIATTPKYKDHPFVHLSASANEDDIENAIMELIEAFRPSEEIVPDQVGQHALKGLTIVCNGKELNLSKEDFLDLKDMMSLCDKFGFKIREVITVDN